MGKGHFGCAGQGDASTGIFGLIMLQHGDGERASLIHFHHLNHPEMCPATAVPLPLPAEELLALLGAGTPGEPGHCSSSLGEICPQELLG